MRERQNRHFGKPSKDEEAARPRRVEVVWKGFAPVLFLSKKSSGGIGIRAADNAGAESVERRGDTGCNNCGFESHLLFNVVAEVYAA